MSSRGRKQTWASVWIAANTALSAILYLFTFIANVNALVTYYNYAYRCPHAPLDSSLLRRDSICRAIRAEQKLHSLFNEFWVCVAFLIVAHVTYPFVFWVTLDPVLHPFRLAYFMPIIQLYRLLHLVRNKARLEDLQQSFKESRSLYSVLGASLETAPLFLVQYVVVVRLAEYVVGSSNPYQQAQRIPVDVVVSLIASMVSCGYNTSMAVVPLIDSKHMRMSSIMCVGLVAGCHAIISMIVKAVNAASQLAGFSSHGIPISQVIYIMAGVIVPWVLIGRFMAKHCRSEGWCLRIMHSFALALVTRFIGPIYLTLKLGKNPRLLLQDMILHIFVELVSMAFLYLLQKKQFPCQSRHFVRSEVERNKYMTCKVFLGTICLSFSILILTTLLVVWLFTKSGTDARCAPTPSDDDPCNVSNEVVAERDPSRVMDIHTSKHSDIKGVHQKTMKAFFKTFLFVITFFLNGRSRAMYAFEYQARTYPR